MKDEIIVGYSIRKAVRSCDKARASAHDDVWSYGEGSEGSRDYDESALDWAIGFNPSLTQLHNVYQHLNHEEFCIICVTTPRPLFQMRNLIRRLVGTNESLDIYNAEYDPRMDEFYWEIESSDTASFGLLGWDGASAFYNSDPLVEFPWDRSTETGALGLFGSFVEADLFCKDFNETGVPLEECLFPAKVLLVTGPRPRFIRECDDNPAQCACRLAWLKYSSQLADSDRENL